MTEKIKTTISIPETMWDLTGQLVPSGNYYYHINEVKPDGIFSGNLVCRGDYGEFQFDAPNLIKMMAIGQSRLARRANINDEYIPDYRSPLTSPTNYKKMPSFLNASIVNNWKESSLKPTIEQCSICLDNLIVKKEIKLLNCLHKFHKDCVNKWLEENDTCPLCRTRQNPEGNLLYGEYTSASVSSPTVHPLANDYTLPDMPSISPIQDYSFSNNPAVALDLGLRRSERLRHRRSLFSSPSVRRRLSNHRFRIREMENLQLH